MKNYRNKVAGFTLVELIVVIGILTILGTIAFVQIGGFAGSARDGSRVSDMTNISKGLDIYRIRTGSYPTPSIPFWASGLTTMSYSGSLVFSQWVVGDSVIAGIASFWSKMSKKPMDPLRTTTEYVYSVSANTAEYQIKTDWEGDSVAFSPHLTSPYQGEESRFSPPYQGGVGGGLFDIGGAGGGIIPQASASSGNPALSYIKGNYNGIIVRTKTSPIYFLALPSIITSATGTLTHTGINNKILVHGETNSGGISYDTTVANFLVYSSGALPSTDAERILLGSGIARAYSGTSLASKVAIKSFVDALATNNTGSLASLGGGVVTSVGGSAASGGGSGGSGGGGSAPTTPAVCGTANGSTGSVAPSTSPLSNVCSVGTLSGSVSGAGPWNWTCNSTDGGSSASCVQYSNLVNGACTGLPANAVYYGGVTSYSLVNASAGTSLVASGVSTPVVNTCQFGCGSGYWLSGGVCINSDTDLRDVPGGSNYYAWCWEWVNSKTCWWPYFKSKTTNEWYWLNYWNSNEAPQFARWCNMMWWGNLSGFAYTGNGDMNNLSISNTYWTVNTFTVSILKRAYSTWPYNVSNARAVRWTSYSAIWYDTCTSDNCWQISSSDSIPNNTAWVSNQSTFVTCQNTIH